MAGQFGQAAGVSDGLAGAFCMIVLSGGGAAHPGGGRGRITLRPVPPGRYAGQRDPRPPLARPSPTVPVHQRSRRAGGARPVRRAG